MYQQTFRGAMKLKRFLATLGSRKFKEVSKLSKLLENSEKFQESYKYFKQLQN